MRKTKWCMIIAFWGVLVGVSLISFFGKDRVFSENENRYLAEKPTLDADTVLSGDFQEGFESYLNDQIAFRDAWITLKTAVQKGMGDTEIGGAYVGKDGYDFEKITPEDFDEALFEKNLNAIKSYFQFCKEQGMEEENLSFLLVPTSGLVLEEKLPAHARMFAQQECMDRVKQVLSDYNYIDVRQELLENSQKQQLYYRTDHHWTTDGAFFAFQKWCRETGHEIPEVSDYDRTQVTDAFRGSLYSKILDADSAYDSIYSYTRKNDKSEYKITKDKEKTDSFYDAEQLDKKDKYAYFFGGNYGQVHIQNQSGGKGNLLLIKDSFANSFAPFLAEYYENIYMVDLRYFKGSMKAYLEENQISDVLVLYNISNFITDRNIFMMGIR